MTAKKFYDWQTAGGVDDVMRLVDALERADIAWGRISPAGNDSTEVAASDRSGCQTALAELTPA